MSAAIYYHPEAYTTSGPKLMGRNAAGESFLKGFLLHSTCTDLWVQVHKVEHGHHFAQAAAALGRKEVLHVVERGTLGALSQPGVVYYPGPGIGEHAWHRAAFGHGAWSLCGITHTTSSAGAMDALANLLTAPVQPWDAVICTSTAVKDNVNRLLQTHGDYLMQRLGAQELVLPQLPVIPLGIHAQDFAYSPQQRAQARSELGTDDATLVVLYVGRLSFHAKAHPLAMYQALQQAAQKLLPGQKLLLLECGWHANDHIEKSYIEAARLACPAVRVLTLDGRLAQQRETAWASADIFCSLSDNIQETFGITPVEAMAAGLPVVVSDWDGYKDTVRDGIDGFRISTLMPGGGLGADLALRHALEIDTYDMYCGHTCSLVAVDVQACADAFIRLAQSRELRLRMGAAGRERARQMYDWKAIIACYETLWAELGAIRKSRANTLKPLAHSWPMRMDPFFAFAGYPTRTLTAQTVLERVDGDVQTALMRVANYRHLTMVSFAKEILPTEQEVRTVLIAATAPMTAQTLVADIPAQRQALVFRSLTWLVKLGVLKIQIF